MKHCTGCDRVLPLSEFHINRRSKDGHQSRCKECLLKYHRERAAPKKPRKRKNSLGGPGTLFPDLEG